MKLNDRDAGFATDLADVFDGGVHKEGDGLRRGGGALMEDVDEGAGLFGGDLAWGAGDKNQTDVVGAGLGGGEGDLGVANATDFDAGGHERTL